MTKNEALKAAIDGKKVQIKGQIPSVYVFWDGFNFMSHDTYCTVIASKTLENQNNWEIVPEFVDFAEAWKAYENGKEIKSASSNWHKKYEHEDSAICLSDIRGKWLILEDE